MILANSPREDRTIALVGGTLIDGSGRDPVENSLVLIKGNMIQFAGPQSEAAIPEDCKFIDISGKTVMPGLMDLHVHLCVGRSDSEQWGGGTMPPALERPWTFVGIKGFARARRALEAGFTTLRDVGDFAFLGIAIRDAVAGGFVEGPRVVASGPYLSATSGHGNALPPWLTRNDYISNVADGKDEILKFVRTQVKMKTDWIKFTATGGGTMNTWDEQQFSDEEISIIIGEAHAKKRPVAAHCVQAKGTLAAIKAGVDSVEHGVELTEESCDLMIRNGTYLVSTLSAPTLIIERGAQYGLAPARIEACRPSYDSHQKSFRMAREMGVRMGCGTDSGLGPVVHGENAQELEFMVKAGMTPMEAIVTATCGSAAVLRMSDKVGTLEAGKFADILVVDGDPLKDIKVLQNKVSLVMKDGNLYVNKIS